jgi:flagellar L-ring protein precursor FlgH
MLFIFGFALTACATKAPQLDPTFNERSLKNLEERQANGLNPHEGRFDKSSADPSASSLWARAAGSPYLIRNQKAQNIGDLLTIVVNESAEATTSATTDTKREGTTSLGGKASLGQASMSQLGEFGFDTSSSNEFKGEGTTDRKGRLVTTVQAVVENVLSNGTLFVRGRKVITINNEDQEVEISGFVRPDDIRINNTVISSVMADAKIRYVGDGVVSDKQRVGWGARLVDAIWPF